MTGYLIRRLLQVVPTIVVSSFAVFLMLHLLPGDPARVRAGIGATPDVVEAVRQDMGLSRPLPQQYVVWLGHTVRGDLGRSITSKLPVSQLIAQRLPATLELAVTSRVLAILLSIPCGMLAATNHRRPADWLISSISALALAVPSFWLAIVAIIIFALVLSWLPAGGYADLLRNPSASARFLVLPALTLAVSQAAIISRFVKASMLEVLGEDYMRTARAKGLGEAMLVARHGLRNALVPVVSVLGLEFGRLLGGAVIVESLFAWPGIGQLMVQAVGDRDYTVVQGTLLVLVLIFVLVNLLTDLVYGVIDPRIRLSAGAAR